MKCKRWASINIDVILAPAKLAVVGTVNENNREIYVFGYKG